MSFVGLISKSSDYEFIKNELSGFKNDLKLDLININKNNIKNIKNVKFETIVVCDDLKELKTQKIFADNIINNANFLLINTDNNVSSFNIKNDNIQIITYGMNQKATVTASSIKEYEVLICLQRNIENTKGIIIEMQEFKKKREKIRNEEIYNLLVVFILEQLYN